MRRETKKKEERKHVMNAHIRKQWFVWAGKNDAQAKNTCDLQKWIVFPSYAMKMCCVEMVRNG